MCNRLARLFELRHILCHEVPRREVYKRQEITGMLTAANQFACATNEVLHRILFGNTPTTLPEMAAQAGADLQSNEQLLADIASRLDGGPNRKAWRLFQKANKHWMEFRDAYAGYRAALVGPAATEWMRIITANRLTCSHIDDLMHDLPKYNDE